MTKQRKGAALAGVVAVLFVTLQIAFGIQTGLAGLFIMGIAGGLLIGGEMARDAKEAK